MYGYIYLLTYCFITVIYYRHYRGQTMDNFPPISLALLEHFQRIFPDKIPTHRGLQAADIAFLQGQQSVIKRMEFLYEDDKPINEDT